MLQHDAGVDEVDAGVDDRGDLRRGIDDELEIRHVGAQSAGFVDHALRDVHTHATIEMAGKRPAQPTQAAAEVQGGGPPPRESDRSSTPHERLDLNASAIGKRVAIPSTFAPARVGQDRPHRVDLRKVLPVSLILLELHEVSSRGELRDSPSLAARMSSIARLSWLPHPPMRGTAAGSASLYGLLLAVASVLGLVKTVGLAKVLGAEDLGYYGLIIIVLPFGTYLSTAGTLAVLGVELPKAFGARDPDAAGLRDRALGLVILATTVIAAVYLAIVAVASPNDPNMRAALLLAATTVALNSVFEFFLTVLRARVRLVPLASAYLGRSALSLVATLIAAALFGYQGAILAEAAVLLLAVLYISRALEPSVRPRVPRRRESARLIRSGILLSVANILLAVSIFADRSFVAATLPEDLGQYTFAAVIALAWFAVTGFVAQAVGASALHDYGGGLALSEVRRRVGRATAIVLGAGTVGLPVVILLAHWLKRAGFSEYAAGLDIVPMLYAGGALTAFSVYGYLLLAVGRYGLVLAAASAGVMVGLGGGLVIALGTPSLEDYAWLCFVSQAATAIATLAAGESVYRSHRRQFAS